MFCALSRSALQYRVHSSGTLDTRSVTCLAGPMKPTWTRIDGGYQSGSVQIFDNGSGLGSAKGSGRWAVVIDGKWRINVDSLAEAKALKPTKEGAA